MYPSRNCCKLASILALLSSGAAHAFDPCHDMASYTPIKQRYTKGLLFTVEKCGLPPSYLFGTEHLDNAKVEQAAGSAFRILPQVTAVGLEEIATEEQSQKAVLRYMVLPNANQRLRDLIGEREFARLQILFKTSPMLPVLDRLRPWAAAALLDFVDNKPGGKVLDEKIKQAASLAGHPLFGLETIDEQFSLFNQLSQPQQIAMLLDAIDHYAEMKQISDEVAQAYLAQDAAKITRLSDEVFQQGDDPALNDFLREKLLLNRNRNMEQRLLPHLQQGHVLLAVGVLHLLGEGGILQLLEKDGFAVSVMGVQ